MKFTFNGISSDEMGLYRVYIDKEQATHPLGGARTITTAKAMYSHKNIITKVSPEPLTFSLTFTAMDKPFTPIRIREIYSYFDVDNYAKLSFNTNPEFYYNVMPMTNQTDLNLYCGDVGYFSLDFVCDSHHGWIDREYKFSTSDEGLWEIYNESNVRNEYGNYLVYPTIKVNMKKGTHFGICPQYKVIADNTDGQLDLTATETYNWFRLVNLNYTYNETNDTGLQFTIDNMNKQIYNDTNNVNLLSHIYMKGTVPQYNFVGLQEGHTYLYRERLNSDTALDFDMIVKASYPVIT
jgi:phage-related protein